MKDISAEIVPQGQVYFIRAGKMVKIGFSTRPLERLRYLQTSHPGQMEIIGTMKGTYALEAKLHGSFHRYWVRGEWFELSRDIVRYIEANTVEGQARAAAKREAYLSSQQPRPRPAADTAAELTAIRQSLIKALPTLPEAARQIARNLIQQAKHLVDGSGNPDTLPSLMRYQMERLQQASAQ